MAPQQYGVLAEIEALGSDLLEVRQLEPQRKSPESGDRLPSGSQHRARLACGEVSRYLISMIESAHRAASETASVVTSFRQVAGGTAGRPR
jgi:hypothetical protein